MKYKDLFIDFDDTLYDTHGNAEIALSETFDWFHLERYFDDPQVFYDAYWWANIDLWGRYSKGEITRDYLIVEPGVIEGAHELMDYLKGRVYRMHMTSNGFHEVQYKKLAACGLRNYFDTIILSEDAGVNKPSPQYFDYAMKVSGAQRETTLMIGDNLQTDILGTLSAGIDAMLFNRWEIDKKDIPQETTFVVDNLRDIMCVL